MSQIGGRPAILAAKLWLPLEKFSPTEIMRIKAKCTLQSELAAVYGGFDAQKELVLYTIDADQRRIGVPRVWGMQHFQQRFDIDDRRVRGRPNRLVARFPDGKDYRQGQRAWVDKLHAALKQNGLGTIGCARPGFGKTTLSVIFACELGLSTIILVHKSFLMDQWRIAVNEMTGADAGIVHQDKCIWEGKSFVVAMVQSLVARRYDPAMYLAFGLVIGDEVHRMGAPTWVEATAQFPAQYFCGISATPRRKDGMENAFFWGVGAISAKHLAHDLKPQVYRVLFRTALTKKQWTNYTGKPNLAKLQTSLGKIPERNMFLADELVKMWKAGRKILVLSHRKGHLEIMKSLVDQKLSSLGGLNQTGFYIGGMGKGERALSAKRRVIFATYPMASEGLDIPSLDTLMLSTPASDVEQAVGRIQRKYDEKKAPLVFDVCDDVPSLKGSEGSRRRFYRQKGFEIADVGFAGYETANGLAATIR